MSSNFLIGQDCAVSVFLIFCIVLMEMASKKRNYSLKSKLDIIRSYERGVTGKCLPAIAKVNRISIETLRGWFNKREELDKALLNTNVEAQKARRFDKLQAKKAETKKLSKSTTDSIKLINAVISHFGHES
jgi:hypothetical protein